MSAPASEDEHAFWKQPLAALVADLCSDPSGLSSDDASARLIRYGPNVLRPKSGVPCSLSSCCGSETHW